ncbi:hypothetical protein QBC47DRAFT_413668 [Echria macrotheca]|uniref:CCHC-type domain-containing protein n=1 Tax=Echria macrotheca TaxID=438768 RepID=A0AAJ0FC93_9PEZI|nr:hypothetical protein QBC47DRAFT_413668 [Echria macrotheca]
MDHRDRIRQNHELLKVDRLGDLTLLKLAKKVQQDLPSAVSNERRLGVFVEWLNDRLAVVDASNEHEFDAEVLQWCKMLEVRDYDRKKIVDALDEWREAHQAVDPASFRRLLLATETVKKSLPSPSPSKSLEIKAPVEGYGNIHPDRLKLSRSAIAGDGCQNPEVDISSNNWRQLDKGSVNGKQPSFLTGSNGLATGRSDLIESCLVFDLGRAQADLAQATKKARNRAKKAAKKQARAVVPPSYICKRCEEPGHFVQDCPTNGDPRYDLAPPPGYICDACGKPGHFISECRRRIEFLEWATTPRIFPPRRPDEQDDDGPRRHEPEQRAENLRERSRQRSASPRERNRRDESVQRGWRHRSRSRLRHNGARNEHSEVEPKGKERDVQGTVPKRGRGSTLKIPDVVRQEGRLSYEDEDGEITVSPAAEKGSPIQADSPAQMDFTIQNDDSVARCIAAPSAQFSLWLEDAISAATQVENSDIIEEQEIELGMSQKSLDKQPPYDPVVRQLVPQEANVWIRRVKRNPSWALWDEGSAEDEAIGALPMADAVVPVVGSSVPQDGTGEVPHVTTDAAAAADTISTARNVPNVVQLPHGFISDGHDTDVVMADAAKDVSAVSDMPAEASLIPPNIPRKDHCNDAETDGTVTGESPVFGSQDKDGKVSKCIAVDTSADAVFAAEHDTTAFSELQADSNLNTSIESHDKDVVMADEDAAALDATAAEEPIIVLGTPITDYSQSVRALDVNVIADGSRGQGSKTSNEAWGLSPQPEHAGALSGEVDTPNTANPASGMLSLSELSPMQSASLDASYVPSASAPSSAPTASDSSYAPAASAASETEAQNTNSIPSPFVPCSVETVSSSAVLSSMEQVMLDMQEDEDQEQKDLLPPLAGAAQQEGYQDVDPTL